MPVRSSPQDPKAAGTLAALKVLDEHWDGHLPVRPLWIARVMKIEVVREDLPEAVAGMLECREGRSRIHLNRRDRKSRQNFTLAHEMGHFVMHRGRDVERVDYRARLATRGIDDDEIFANAFAAELLMPEPMVRALLERGVGAKQMAREFRVSAKAMDNRLESLGWQ